MSPQPRGEQLGSAASRPAASSLPASLHALRSGQGARGRCLLGVRPPPEQAAGPRPARLPGRSAVRHNAKEKSLTLFNDGVEIIISLVVVFFVLQEVLARFHS